MKIILWGVFALAALLWTGAAALLAELIQWSAQGLAASDGAAIGTAAATMPMPPWLSPWIDIAAWAALQQTVGGALTSASAVLPILGDVAAWLVPAVWVTWGLGLLALLGLTLVGAWLMRRFQNPVRSDPHAA